MYEVELALGVASKGPFNALIILFDAISLILLILSYTLYLLILRRSGLIIRVWLT